MPQERASPPHTLARHAPDWAGANAPASRRRRAFSATAVRRVPTCLKQFGGVRGRAVAAICHGSNRGSTATRFLGQSGGATVPSVAKARALLAEAIPFHLEGLRAAGEPVPESLLEWVEV